MRASPASRSNLVAEEDVDRVAVRIRAACVRARKAYWAAGAGLAKGLVALIASLDQCSHVTHGPRSGSSRKRCTSEVLEGDELELRRWQGVHS